MTSRLEALMKRRVDSSVLATLKGEAFAKVSEGESVKYAIGSMQPIDPEYTKNTFAEAQRVIDQLRAKLATSCDYRFQGSVTNDTHIKAVSDIDTLTIIQKFYTLEPPQVPQIPYRGDPIADLEELRRNEVDVLRQAFPRAQVDESGSKSIVVTGGSLRRKIDIVPSNWYDSVRYASSKNEVVRGIQVLNKESRERILNYPFLHNAWIAAKDERTGGGLRKSIRLMKSLRYDEGLENVISSYSIAGLAFNMPDELLSVVRPHELRLVENTFVYCRGLIESPAKRDALMVPTGLHKLFGGDGLSPKGLEAISQALGVLCFDIMRDAKRSFAKLSEARIEY